MPPNPFLLQLQGAVNVDLMGLILVHKLVLTSMSIVQSYVCQLPRGRSSKEIVYLISKSHIFTIYNKFCYEKYNYFVWPFEKIILRKEKQYLHN